jgi:monoamine oxidase
MKAVVVGAGFAGLAAAARLLAAGVEVDVFEARDRVGGRVWSVPFSGAVVERGAEFILPGHETVFATARRLGLRLVRKGMLYGEREPRGSEPVTLEQVQDGLERIAADPARAAGAGTVADALARYDLPPGVSEAIRARVEVTCGCPADALDASVLDDTGVAFGPYDTFTVEGGNDGIARGLAAELGDRVHLASPVRRVAWSEDGVRLRAGSHVAVANAAVLAVPGTLLGAITFAPQLPDEKLAAIAHTAYGQAAKLFVALRTPAPPSQTLSVPGRWWCWTQLDADGQPLPFVAAFAGTARALEDLAVAAGPKRWLDELRRLRPDLDLDAETAMVSTWQDDPWARAAYSATSARHGADPELWTAPAGALAFAGEHTAGDWHALMEGALRSGERAAQQLLQIAGR